VNDSYLGSSPDGARFVVASRKDGNSELYVIDTTGAQLARLTETDADESDPDWSPDGARIAFRSNRGGAWDIWIMSADGSDPRQITDFAPNDSVKGYQGEGPPRWSPDGMRIAFPSHRDGDWDVCTMNPDGSDLQNLTQNEVFEDGYPCWSPDGRQIAFFSDRDGNFEIYVMRADGSEPRRVTDNPADDLAPVWVRR
jgi:Tol biopolymer transport system component